MDDVNGTLRSPRRSTRRGAPQLVDEPGVRFGIANAVVVLALLAAAATHLGLESTTVLVVLVAGLAATGIPLGFALGLGLASWAMVTGFVENRFGELTFGRGDLLRLALLVGAVGALSRLLPLLGPGEQDAAS
jgi:hypothetical protein